MGQLYDVVTQIDAVIARRGLDEFKTKGEISMEAGQFVALIFPDTPDDPEKLASLKKAASGVLGETIA